MKTRLLIIIGLIIAIIISVSSLIIIDNIEAQSTLEPTPPTMEEMQSNLDKTLREKTPLTDEEKNRNYPNKGTWHFNNNSTLNKMCKETGQGNVWSLKYNHCIQTTTPFGTKPFDPDMEKCIEDNFEFVEHPETGEMIASLDSIAENCLNH